MQGGDLRSAISQSTAGELDWYHKGEHLLANGVQGCKQGSALGSCRYLLPKAAWRTNIPQCNLTIAPSVGSGMQQHSLVDLAA